MIRKGLSSGKIEIAVSDQDTANQLANEWTKKFNSYFTAIPITTFHGTKFYIITNKFDPDVQRYLLLKGQL